MRILRHARLITMALGLAARVAQAEWPPDGLPLATGGNNQIFPDGIARSDHGLLAFWIDVGPGSYAIYSQVVTPNGTLPPGAPVGGSGRIGSAARPNNLVVQPDGEGGALLVWYDFRNTLEPRGIYGARVDDQGVVVSGWGGAGSPVCTAVNAEDLGPLTQLMQVCHDGAGGGYFAWTDARDTPPQQALVYHVYGQHIGPNGVRDASWPAEGKLLVGGPGYHYPQALLPDATGGFWLVSEDDGSGLAVTQHASNGAVLGRWTTAYASSQPAAVADGAGGIYLAWRDLRANQSDIYVIRLGPGAAPRPGWTATGLAVATTPAPENLPAITQSQGAAIVAWLNDTSGATFYAARRFEPNGQALGSWPSSGVRFSHSPLLVGRPLIVPDGAGGALFAFRRNQPNLFGSHITADGLIPPAFPDTGLSLCSVSGDQFLQDLVFDGLNGAYVLWGDARDYNANRFDVYATHFSGGAVVGPPNPPPGPPLALSGPYPNPTRGPTSIMISLTTGGHMRVEVFDLFGTRVRTLFDAETTAGPFILFQWSGLNDDGEALRPGIYYLRVTVGAESVTRRIVRIE